MLNCQRTALTLLFPSIFSKTPPILLRPRPAFFSFSQPKPAFPDLVLSTYSLISTAICSMLWTFAWCQVEGHPGAVISHRVRPATEKGGRAVKEEGLSGKGEKDRHSWVQAEGSFWCSPHRARGHRVLSPPFFSDWQEGLKHRLTCVCLFPKQ